MRLPFRVGLGWVELKKKRGFRIIRYTISATLKKSRFIIDIL